MIIVKETRLHTNRHAEAPLLSMAQERPQRPQDHLHGAAALAKGPAGRRVLTEGTDGRALMLLR